MDTTEWETKKEDILTISNNGENIILKNVPIQIEKKRRTQRVLIDDLVREEFIQNAKKFGLNPIDIHELLLIYLDSRFFEGKRIIKTTYRFNKMLFYLQKRMEKKNFTNWYIHDSFGAARAGPVPVNLKPSINQLSENGIVNVTWSHKHGTSSEFTLTKRGEEISKSLWETIPDEVKLIYMSIKQDLSLLTPTQLRNKVHVEYPEYRRVYTELDDEP